MCRHATDAMRTIHSPWQRNAGTSCRSQLVACLDGFGARIREADAVLVAAGRELVQLLGQIRLPFIIKVRAGHVNELVRLRLDDRHHPRVATTRGTD